MPQTAAVGYMAKVSVRLILVFLMASSKLKRVAFSVWSGQAGYPGAGRIEKGIQACVSRAKPRDFYDLYFMLRSRMAFKKAFERDKKLRIKVFEAKKFLPVNQHMVIKNFR